LVLTLDLLVGLGTTPILLREWELLFYPATITVGGMVLSLLSLAASIGVLVSLRAATVRQAAQQLVLPL